MKVSRIQLFPTLIYDVECPELIDDVLKEFSKVKWKDDWTNINHYHKNSFYSGTFYFQDCNSNLVVSKQDPQIHVPSKTKNLGLVSSGEVALKADKGHMILIPGYIRHHIEKNFKGEDRNSLAMNFMPVGLCYSEDSSYNYK